MVDQMNLGFTLTGWTVDQGGSCVQTTSSNLQCDFSVFSPGEIATVEIMGTFVSTTATTISNTVIVDLPFSRVAEENEIQNNVATVDTDILAAPTPTVTPTATSTPTSTTAKL